MGAIRATSIVAALCLLTFGCARDASTNPSFNVSFDSAKHQLDVMRDEAGPERPTLDRPLVVLDGFASPWVGAAWMRQMIGARVNGRIIGVSYPFAASFDDCRRNVIAAVEQEFGEGNERETVEVDVVGLSLGGVVAVYSATENPALGKRLKIHRLFTISSPLTGARLAERVSGIAFTSLQRDLQPGSSFYERLARSPIDYQVVSYTRLDDDVVGAKYASLPGRNAYWLANEPVAPAHLAAIGDPRIIGDILRRLRGEKPLTSDSPSPLPAGAR